MEERDYPDYVRKLADDFRAKFDQAEYRNYRLPGIRQSYMEGYMTCDAKLTMLKAEIKQALEAGDTAKIAFLVSDDAAL